MTEANAGGAADGAAGAAPDLALEREIAALMIEALNLDATPETIDPEAPLYGGGHAQPPGRSESGQAPSEGSEPSERGGHSRSLHAGLGLDSIDILEVALVVSKQYGFQLRSDDDDNVRTFASLRNLALHVARHRAD